MEFCDLQPAVVDVQTPQSEAVQQVQPSVVSDQPVAVIQVTEPVLDLHSICQQVGIAPTNGKFPLFYTVKCIVSSEVLCDISLYTFKLIYFNFTETKVQILQDGVWTDLGPSTSGGVIRGKYLTIILQKLVNVVKLLLTDSVIVCKHGLRGGTDYILIHLLQKQGREKQRNIYRRQITYPWIRLPLKK